jgi:hypothetical protein
MPEFVVAGKRMEKNDRRSVPPNFIKDFSVVTAQVFHGRDYMSNDARNWWSAGLPARPLGC